MNRHHLVIGRPAAVHFALALFCLFFVFAFGLRIIKSEPARPADYNSIKPIYVSRSHPNASINEVLRFVARQDPSHLPLYHVALSLWVHYTGRDLLTIRLMSLLTGLLAIAVTYQLARATSGRNAALDLVLLASFLAFFLFYTHQARMYALLTLISPWLLWSYWKLQISSKARAGWRWLSLLASSVAIIYTHYFGFFLLAALAIYHLLFAPKNRRWWQTCLALALAGLLFLPWAPYTLSILQSRQGQTSDALSMADGIVALGTIYSNGQPAILLAAAAILILRIKRLTRPQAFILFQCAVVLGLLLVANEFTALIIARRIRYTIAAGMLLTCALAIALNEIPRWVLLRPLFMAAWIALFALFWRSEDLYLYTNQLHQQHKTVPHYQNLLYEPSIDARPSDFVVSFHQNTPINEKKQLDYYGRRTGDWRGLIHIWIDEEGQAALMSTDTRYNSVASMDSWDFPIWLIYNPQETNLQAMPVFTDDFSARFHACGRYLETDNTIIELYALRTFPCELLTDGSPQALHYDNGTELANILLEMAGDELNIFFWWAKTFANEYAYSIQLFDAESNKALQADDVIGGSALVKQSIDVSDLPLGEFTAKLIVYDYETRASQSGEIAAKGQAFERSFEIGLISKDD